MNPLFKLASAALLLMATSGFRCFEGQAFQRGVVEQASQGQLRFTSKGRDALYAPTGDSTVELDRRFVVCTKIVDAGPRPSPQTIEVESNFFEEAEFREFLIRAPETWACFR